MNKRGRLFTIALFGWTLLSFGYSAVCIYLGYINTGSGRNYARIDLQDDPQSFWIMIAFFCLVGGVSCLVGVWLLIRDWRN